MSSLPLSLSQLDMFSFPVSDFDDGESWGYRKFYELAKLVSNDALCHCRFSLSLHSLSLSFLSLSLSVCLQESDGFLRDDTLVLRFSIRPFTNHQKCKDLSTYIRRLEQKKEILEKVHMPSNPSTSGYHVRHHRS